MSGLFRFLSEPYPFEDDWRSVIRTQSLIAIFVALFLYVFRPFGLNTINHDNQTEMLVFAGYGLVTFSVCFFFELILRNGFPGFTDDRYWTVGKQILSLLLLVSFIGLGNLFYSYLLGFTGLSSRTLVLFQVYTLMVAIFPVTLMTMVSRVRILKQNLSEARLINNSIDRTVKAEISVNSFHFESENNMESIELTPDQFLFAESADNYSDIVYCKDGIIRKDLLRTSLKGIMNNNDPALLFMPHRSYIINLLKVEKVSGNSRGYKVSMHGIDRQIPVSRKNASGLKSRLEKLYHTDSSL